MRVCRLAHFSRLLPRLGRRGRTHSCPFIGALRFPKRRDTADLARSPSSVAIQAAPPECSAISRPTGDVAEPSDGHDRSEAGASALAIAAGQNAGGRWGEGRCPGFTCCWQVNGVRAASSARQSFGVVNQTGTERGHTPEKGDPDHAPLLGRERRCSDPWLIVPPLRSRSHDQRRSFFATASRTPPTTGLPRAPFGT
jgi:hypothetical protein